jgi:tRNA threonylcarbamoyladenosine biosynthesis protein TsaE
VSAPTPGRGHVALAPAGPADAATVVGLVHAAFGARPPLDPPATALEETEESVARALADHAGLLATRDGAPVGAMLLEPEGEALWMRRVSVHPGAQGAGVAGALVGAAERHAADAGHARLMLLAREELPATLAFWDHLGYAETCRDGPWLTLGKALPFEVVAASAEDTRTVGERLAALLRRGDLVLLSGDLGAGKTTFTQGLGEGLGVRGGITSPTFVISRVHPSLVGGPALVHVDAYRLGGMEELDDLDLDTSLEEAVTVVEWGEGVAEGLADTRLEVVITRTRGDDPSEPDALGGDDARHLRITPVGARWIGSELRTVLA